MSKVDLAKRLDLTLATVSYVIKRRERKSKGIGWRLGKWVNVCPPHRIRDANHFAAFRFYQRLRGASISKKDEITERLVWHPLWS